jgi:hypothetical protein
MCCQKAFLENQTPKTPNLMREREQMREPKFLKSQFCFVPPKKMLVKWCFSLDVIKVGCVKPSIYLTHGFKFFN